MKVYVYICNKWRYIAMKKILYLGWLGYNNLGDELMWELFEELCFKFYGSKCIVVPSPPDISTDDISDYDTIVLGGGSILLPQYINWIYHALEMDKKIIIWGSGYDWADRKYIDLLEEGIDQNLLYDGETVERLEEIVNKSAYIGVRGPLTYSLLESANINMDKVCLSGDPGLLLKADKFPKRCPIINWSNEDKIIAVNWSTSKNDIYGEDEEYIENQLAQVCKILLEQNYKIYMYIMWPIDIACNRRLYDKVGYHQNVVLDSNLYKAGELTRILKKCTMSINFKLHGNIISAAAGIPFVCLGYRFKCFDFVKSMDLNELIVSTDEKRIVQAILGRISFINANRPVIIHKLSMYKELYRKRLIRPFGEKLF